MTGKTYYHVAGNDYRGGDILSLYARMGDAAYDEFANRWPEAAEMAFAHAHYVFLYQDRSDADDHAAAFGGQVVAVDGTGLDVVVDAHEGFPVVRDRIPSGNINPQDGA